MRRVRAQLTLLGPAFAGLFALTIALPPPALRYHEHDGGGRAHVHADDDAALAELLEHHHHGHDHDADHGHQHHAHHQAQRPVNTAGPEQSSLAADDGAGNGHWHERLRFHRAVAATLPALSAGGAAGDVPVTALWRPGHVSAQPGHARGPPFPPSLS